VKIKTWFTDFTEHIMEHFFMAKEHYGILGGTDNEITKVVDEINVGTLYDYIKQCVDQAITIVSLSLSLYMNLK
jgi:hypothetical protein